MSKHITHNPFEFYVTAPWKWTLTSFTHKPVSCHILPYRWCCQSTFPTCRNMRWPRWSVHRKAAACRWRVGAGRLHRGLRPTPLTSGLQQRAVQYTSSRGPACEGEPEPGPHSEHQPPSALPPSLLCHGWLVMIIKRISRAHIYSSRW